MAELLLEILSEEIPARMQARAAEDLKRLVCEGLDEKGLGNHFSTARSFVTPRRLALVIDNLPARQMTRVETRRGPRADAPAQAIEGFLRSTGLTLAQCEQRATDKGTFWFAVIRTEGKPTDNVLPVLVHKAFASIGWPKSMRWASNRFTWIRPLHSIIAIFNGKPLRGVLLLEGGRAAPTVGGFVSTETMLALKGDGLIENHITFSNFTVGHRFLGRKKRFTVKNFADYKKQLRKGYVILDPAERRAVIARDAAKLAKAKGLSLVADEGLMNEVVGLVEWPVALLGRIDESFMDLPPEVLATVMRHHQKYFALRDASGKLAPFFVAVANIDTKDKGAAIVAGNERVLRARLADARFFWDQDRKKKLADRVPALKDRVFHAKLGTDFDRTQRLRALASELARFVPGADKTAANRAAELSKADLTTGMVGEFPELQGIVGRYYALHDGEQTVVADAIAEHYRPLGPNDACPKAPVSVAVALADKIDTLIGFFIIDEKPTGSKDPFALRRAALGVIRLLVENGLRLQLQSIIQKALYLYPETIIRHSVEYAAALLEERKTVNEIPDRAAVVKHLSRQLLTFFTDRMKVALKEKGVRHDLIDAVFAVRSADGALEDDLVRLLARVDALKAFLATADGANLLVAYRRAANILKIEEKKDGRGYDPVSDPTLLTMAEEKTLDAALNEAAPKIAAALAAEKFQDAMRALSALRAPVDLFFDKVTVNSDDPNLRANRLRLLSRIRAALGGVADFSKIEG